MISRILSIPSVPLLLGLGGALPFVAGAGVIVLGNSAVGGLIVTPVLIAYGAVILSFLGGALWGLALRQQAGALIYGFAVVPSLWGWTGAIISGQAGLGMLAAGFIGWRLIEAVLLPRLDAPLWYARLRTLLTLIVAPSLGVAAVFTA